MKKTALVLAAVMASGMILTACGGNKTADAPTTAAGTETTTAAAEGETAAPAEEGGSALDLAVQVGPDPETVDPALNSAVDGANMIIHAFETLIRLTQPYTSPSSSATYRVPASRAARACSTVGYFPRCQLVKEAGRFSSSARISS